MRLKTCAVLIMCAASLSSLRARASGSLYVDDPGVTPTGRCQIESWMRTYAPGLELTSVPACTIAGFEYSMGITRYDFAPGLYASPQVKYTLRDPDRNRLGAAVAIGAFWSTARRRFDTWSVNVPLSIALDSEHGTMLFLNIGTLHQRGGRTAPAGGIGLQHAFSGSWTLLVETYRADGAYTLQQAGLRRSFGDAVSLDLLAGHQKDTRTDCWLAVGLNVLLPE
jgi:hypothetical protein